MAGRLDKVRKEREKMGESIMTCGASDNGVRVGERGTVALGLSGEGDRIGT